MGNYIVRIPTVAVTVRVLVFAVIIVYRYTRYNYKGRSLPVLEWPVELISFSVTLSHSVPKH